MKLIKEFYPWSSAIYANAVKSYKDGRFSILDVQLSGKCNYGCIYCDSPDRTFPSLIDFEHLEQLIRKAQNLYDWMFICGLGEPLHTGNRPTLLKLLNICESTGIKCTIFTNGSNIDEVILDFVRKEVLYPLIKIDTFNENLAGVYKLSIRQLHKAL